ncbi:MAG: hypothetical protein ACRCX2_13605 [Paraclostridium sp.]
MYLRKAALKDLINFNTCMQELHRQNYTDRPNSISSIRPMVSSEFKELIHDKGYVVYISTNKEDTEVYGYAVIKRNKDNAVVEQMYTRMDDRVELLSKVLAWCKKNDYHRVYARCKKWNSPYLKDLKDLKFIPITIAGDWVFLTNYIK